MDNQFTHLSDFDINLMIAKEEMKSQPFIKYLPQRDLFGNDILLEDCSQFKDESLYIITESGKEQKIDFCSLDSLWTTLLVKEKISLSWYDEGGGNCHTDTSFFVDFSGELNYPRAVAICYLISKGLLEKE